MTVSGILPCQDQEVPLPETGMMEKEGAEAETEDAMHLVSDPDNPQSAGMLTDAAMTVQVPTTAMTGEMNRAMREPLQRVSWFVSSAIELVLRN